MSEFECGPCNYATNNKSNFNKHVKSKKHYINNNKIINTNSRLIHNFHFWTNFNLFTMHFILVYTV